MSATLRRPIAVNNNAQPPASQSLAGIAPRRAELPNDLLEELTGRLGPRELASLGRVSRAWRAAVDDPALWRRHAARLRQPTGGSVATLKAACHYAFHAEANLQAGRVTATRNLRSSAHVGAPSWSPDGRQIAWGSGRCVRIADARTGAQLAKFSYSAAVWQVSWKPVGSRIAVGCSGGSLSITDTSTRAWRLTARSGVNTSVSHVSWSPDGANVAWAYGRSSLHITDGRTGAQLARDDCAPYFINVAWSPDSAKVLWDFEDYSIRIVDVRTGALLRTFDGFTHPSEGWSPDSNRIALVTGDLLRITNVSTGEQVTAAVSGVEHAFWSPDGTKVFSACRDQAVRVTQVSTGAQTASHQYGLGYSRTFKNPDGTKAAMTPLDTLRILDTSTGAQLARLDSFRGVQNVYWSPDGDRVVVRAKPYKSWSIVDVNTGVSLVQLKDNSQSPEASWSPDGTKVLIRDSFGRSMRIVDFAPVPRPWWVAALNWL